MTTSPLLERLRSTMGQVLYQDLLAHLNRDALWVVKAPLDLETCALAVARNHSHAVKLWLEAGSLHKPDPALREKIIQEPACSCLALVVQPFVLIQL